MSLTLIYVLGAQVVVFGVMLAALKWILLRDTLDAVRRLKEEEGELGKKEDAVRRRLEEHEAEYRRKAADMQEELARAREQAEKESQRLRDSLVEEARKEKDRILAEAERGRERMRQDLVQETEARAMEYAGRVFELVFSERIGAALNRLFLDELIEALAEVDGTSITIDAQEALLESAQPVEPDQKKRLVEVIGRTFGVEPVITEKSAPELISGVRIKLGSLEIDGSLRNRFREAGEELKKSRAV